MFYMAWANAGLRVRPALRLHFEVVIITALFLAAALGPALAAAKNNPAQAPIPAPELIGTTWINVPSGTNISLGGRKGKVTVVHFWTFGCINCKRNLGFYRDWQKQFGPRGVEIIGIHTPETEEEKSLENVGRKIKEYGITYPVLVDKESQNWRTWQQRYWPTVYLIDKRGRVRFAWEGELEYNNAGGNAKMTALIEQLLRE